MIASLVNVFITIGASLVLVVDLDKGAIGVIVGNFTGTLVVYLALLGYRREQLGLSFDRDLLRQMNKFGLPLVPTARLPLDHELQRPVLHPSARHRRRPRAEVGLYSVGVRVASAMVLLLTAFRTAWPAFAYSIRDDREARRTYAFVLTYLTLVTSWVALLLTLLSPWIVDALTDDGFSRASTVVGPLAFSTVSYGAYIVFAIGVGRIRRTQFNWVVTGPGALANFALNVLLIPSYGMMGAAIATVAAYTTMAVGMAWWSQRIYPVPYQWRRTLTAVLAAVALAVLGKLIDVDLAFAILLTLVYPLVLLAAGFALPDERARLRAVVLRR